MQVAQETAFVVQHLHASSASADRFGWNLGVEEERQCIERPTQHFHGVVGSGTQWRTLQKV